MKSKLGIALLGAAALWFSGCSQFISPDIEPLRSPPQSLPNNARVTISEVTTGPWVADGPAGTFTFTGDGVTANPKLRYSTAQQGPLQYTLSTVFEGESVAVLPLQFLYNGNHGEAGAAQVVSFVIPADGSGTVTSNLVIANTSDEFSFATPTAYFVVFPGDVYGFYFGGTSSDPDPHMSGTFTVLLLDEPSVIEMNIDVVPGSDKNVIVCNSWGVVPVVVYGSADFDVTSIDTDTLTFGSDGATPAHAVDGHLEDSDGDGYMDLVLHFRQLQTGLSPDDTITYLTGTTYDGIELSGSDSTTVIESKRRSLGHLKSRIFG